LILVLVFFSLLISLPPVDDFLDSRMVGKAFFQNFFLIASGMLMAHKTEIFPFKDNPERASGLIIFSFIFLFWSIPRSIDLSEIHWWIDQLNHLSMFAGGFILLRSLKGLPTVAKGVYGILFSSMLTATAMVYRWKKVILCSTYTLEDQHLYGKVLLIFGIALYTSVILWIIFGWSRR